MRTRLIVAVVSIAGLLAAVPVVAHHSFAAEYDADKPIKLTGTVTRIEWTNPHRELGFRDGQPQRAPAFGLDAQLAEAW
jgi:hypothetical protein